MIRTLCLGWLASAAPGFAADPDNADVSAVTNAKQYLGITSADLDCPPSAVDGAITVCGKRKASPRIDPPERDTTAGRPDAKTTALGSPPIPPRPPSVTIGICFLQKCPKKPYYIDVSALPKAPPGSDADKIARGEMRAP
ncbi:MAG: hypothetical protein J7485_13065 [Sphingobium sp.]|nr:hypothetical protein [Sphingobium sp.]